jgi:hypothetical protein
LKEYQNTSFGIILSSSFCTTCFVTTKDSKHQKKNTKNCWEDLQFSDTLRPMTPNWCCRESPPSDTPLLKIPDFLSSLCQSVIHQNFKVLMKVWIGKSTINGGFSRKPRLIPEGKQPFCFFT